MSGRSIATVLAPSTTLAHALSLLEHAIQREPSLQSSLVTIADKARNSNEEAWQLDTEDFYEAIHFNPDSLSADAGAQWLAGMVGILDAWHRFANPALMRLAGIQPPPAALSAEGRLDREGRYNEDADAHHHGRLIPAACLNVPVAADAARTPLTATYEAYRAVHAGGRGHYPYDHLPDDGEPMGANRLLKNTTWLPQTLACGHPDGTQGPLRQVATGYVRIGILTNSPALPRDEGLRIAVAPLAETRACIDVIVTDAGTRYLVAPAFSIERAKAAIREAYSAGAHILLLPEMTIDDRWLPELAATAQQTRRAQRRSPLRYIILGATRAPQNGIVGENFVVVIDGAGNLVSSGVSDRPARQDKICRWNLGRGDQRRFGFDRDRTEEAPLAPCVVESIHEADTVFVFDIVGFGRLVCLICASLDHNQPSDWLVQHTQPDWIYAPVMDSSICWSGCRTSPLEKWTVKRAVRAACLSRGKVVVSNSMALQAFENAELAYPNNPDGTPKRAVSHQPKRAPAVALMIDGGSESLPHQVLRALIPEKADDAAPVLISAAWNDDWNGLPRSLPEQTADPRSA